MQQRECAQELITPKEAVTFGRMHSTLNDIDTVRAIEREYKTRYFSPEDTRFRYYVMLSTIYNAGRIQGIREQRERNRRKEARA